MKRQTIILFVVLLLSVSFFFLRSLGSSSDQPIRYSHRLHIEQGLECTDCHTGAETEAFATIPDIETCLGCHEQAVTDSREEEKIRELARAGSGIPWIQVYEVPDHVYFSHARHVAIAELACEECHGEVKTREAPFTKPLVELSMDFCLDCHRERGASEDCIACHR